MVGMIMWQKAKRAVSPQVAKDIALLAEDHGVQSVGVFVDETAQQIQDMCYTSKIQVAQLHGSAARQALPEISEDLHVVYVMHSNQQGSIQTPSPAELAEQTDQVLHRYGSCAVYVITLLRIRGHMHHLSHHASLHLITHQTLHTA